ncbi:Uncharacterised protein [Serratia ficaria]|nr:Uncharacterised protein [Serratia ficaria]
MAYFLVTEIEHLRILNVSVIIINPLKKVNKEITKKRLTKQKSK